jgi:ferritin
MLSEKVLNALNKQIELEGYASFLYLSMASWCDKEALAGCTAFMRRQSDEEREHMLKLYDYISDRDGHALTPSVAQVPHEFDSVQNMFEMVYAHEQKVSASINNIVTLCLSENDHTTQLFLQWYIGEQQEEEALMRSILDTIKLIGNGPQSLYYIDKEIQKINDAELKAEAAGE